MAHSLGRHVPGLARGGARNARLSGLCKPRRPGRTPGRGAARGRACAGDRVLLAAPNCPQYLEILYGIWWAGCAPVPANAKLHGAELAYMCAHAGARICFAADKQAGAIAAEAPEGLERLIVVGSSDYEAMFAGESQAPWLAAPDELAWLFYTSGTTGKPKARCFRTATCWR